MFDAAPILDELMASAWPPPVVELDHGWRLRWAGGFTRRANSALPARAGTGDGPHVPGLVARAEAFYAARDAPARARFQVSSASAPPSLPQHLADRGYTPSGQTWVVQSGTADVLRRTSPPGAVELTAGEPTDAWFASYWGSVHAGRGRTDRHAAVCRQSLLRPAPPAAATFVAVTDPAAGTVGVAEVVVESGWAGVQCLATRTEFRGRGVGAAVLHAAATVAAEAGAPRMYLAVMDANAAARRLFQRAGFEDSHDYWYWSNASDGTS